MYVSRWHFRTGFLLRARRVLAAIQHCLFSNFTVQSKCNALLERKTGNDNAHQSKRIERFARAARVSKQNFHALNIVFPLRLKVKVLSNLVSKWR
jgi:hypothetical protein